MSSRGTGRDAHPGWLPAAAPGCALPRDCIRICETQEPTSESARVGDVSNQRTWVSLLARQGRGWGQVAADMKGVEAAIRHLFDTCAAAAPSKAREMTDNSKRLGGTTPSPHPPGPPIPASFSASPSPHCSASFLSGCAERRVRPAAREPSAPQQHTAAQAQLRWRDALRAGLMWRLNAGEVSTGVAGHLRNLGAALSHNDFAGATAIQVSRSVSQSVSPPRGPAPTPGRRPCACQISDAGAAPTPFVLDPRVTSRKE